MNKNEIWSIEFARFNAERISHRKLPEILEMDGITQREVAPLYELQESGFSVFMHGSGITAGKFDKKSDVDFAVIGDLTKIPRRVKGTFAQDIDDSLLGKIDYFSMSQKASNGRKLSFHLQNPAFRMDYTTKPYAIEYRTNLHKKHGGKNTYFLGGVSENGDMHIFTLTCPQTKYTDGVINYTPQTSIFHIQDDRALPTKNLIPEFGFEGLVSLDRKTGELRAWEIDSPKELLVIGLELNKMTEDTPFGLTASPESELYTTQPIRKSLDLIEDYTKKDPVTPLVQCLQGRAAIRSQRDGRLRITKNFVDNFSTRLRGIQANQNQS